MPDNSGTLLIVSGPSGVGKSSLCTRLLEQAPALRLSISYTTRAPRGAEVDGEHYHFTDRDTFLEMIQRKRFAEYAQVHGNYYGTSRETVAQALAQGDDLLFDIDYQGARQLKEAFPEAAVAVLLLPPSLSALEARLRGRGTDAPEVIARRLEAARHEMQQFALFDHAVINDELEQAWGDLRSIYQAARLRVGAQRHQIHHLLQS